MAEECHIEPVPSLKETLGATDVLVYVVEPLLYDVFSCHIRVVFMISVQKIRKVFELLGE